MPKAVPQDVPKEPKSSSLAKAASASAAADAQQNNAEHLDSGTTAGSKHSPSQQKQKSDNKRKICSTHECNNVAVKNGVCKRHGAKKPVGHDIKTITIPANQANDLLGIVVEFNEQKFKGALVSGIDNEVCRFRDQIDVGDRIISNNGKMVKCAQDLKPVTGVGERRFQVITAAASAAIQAGKPPPNRGKLRKATAKMDAEAAQQASLLALVHPLSQLPTLASVMKDQVINQVATYMVQRNVPSLANWSVDQAEFFIAATRDFPFLKDVVWENECKKVRDNAMAATAQYSKMQQQAAVTSNPSLEEGFVHWLKRHSTKPKPKYDFSKGEKKRQEQYKKARKEKRDADNAAEALKTMANGEEASPTKPKPKRRKIEVVVGNPYERKFIRTTAKGRRSSVSRRAATEGVEVAEEEDTPAKESGERANDGEDNTISTPASGSATKQTVDDMEAEEDDDSEQSSRKILMKSDDEDDDEKEDGDVNDDSSEEWKPSTASEEWKPKTYNKITFKERVNLCHAFKAEYGHLNIQTAKNDYGLASWAKTMRRNYRIFLSGGEGISPARLRKYGYELEILEEIGFDFGSPDNDEGQETNNNEATEGLSPTNPNNVSNRRIWEYRIEQCRQFKGANNDQMNIPNHDKVLGMFASRMRSLYTDRLDGSRVLTDIEKEKVRILLELGFCFDGNFDANLERFREYKQRTGKSKVPSLHTPGIDKELINWARTIRYDNNRMNRGEKSQYLTSDRLRKLVRVGFDFGDPPKKQAPWEEMFEKLSSYRMEHGKDPPVSNEELGYWVSMQRAAYLRKADGYLKHNMSDEREEKLRSIGFVFRAGRRPTEADKDRLRAGKKKSFDDRLAEFIAWKEEHGHPYVPRDGGEDHHLGKWVARVRMAYKNYKAGSTKKSKYGTLTAEQALALTQAGFAFDASHRWTKSTVKQTDDDQESEEQNVPEWRNYEHEHHADPFV